MLSLVDFVATGRMDQDRMVTSIEQSPSVEEDCLGCVIDCLPF